jgi:hypothetical protein
MDNFSIIFKLRFDFISLVFELTTHVSRKSKAIQLNQASVLQASMKLSKHFQFTHNCKKVSIENSSNILQN